MSVKITEAALWFGAGEVSSYCKHPEFLLAYNNCLHDNCKGDDLTAGKQAGVTACAGVTPNAPGGAPTGPGGDANNSTGHLSGPANAPGANSTIAPNTPGTNPANSTVTPTAVGLNGALPTTPNAPTQPTLPPVLQADSPVLLDLLLLMLLPKPVTLVPSHHPQRSFSLLYPPAHSPSSSNWTHLIRCYPPSLSNARTYIVRVLTS
ncbi:hypothetical protein KEM48_012292 [Puccinia striiformis f. sp. tritici PST-130]|nr:hypothetical protein KEM48_012292 [Puccinia striiformis f. sp. tritici PST-130]